MSETHKHYYKSGLFGGIYFMIAVGVGIYLVQHSTGFWGAVLAIIKAIFFPVMAGYKLAAWLG